MRKSLVLVMALTILITGCRGQKTFCVTDIKITQGGGAIHVPIQDTMNIAVTGEAEVTVKFSDKLNTQVARALFPSAQLADEYTLKITIAEGVTAIAISQELKSRRGVRLDRSYLLNVSLQKAESLEENLQKALATFRVGAKRRDIDTAINDSVHKQEVPISYLFGDYTAEQGLGRVDVYLLSPVPDPWAFQIGERLHWGPITAVYKEHLEFTNDETGRTRQYLGFSAFYSSLDLCVESLMQKDRVSVRVEALYSKNDALLCARVYYLEGRTVNAVVYQGDGSVEVYENIPIYEFNPNDHLPTYRFTTSAIRRVGADAFYRWFAETSAKSPTDFRARFGSTINVAERDISFEQVQLELERLFEIAKIGASQGDVKTALSEKYASSHYPPGEEWIFDYGVYILAGSKELVSFQGLIEKLWIDEKLPAETAILKGSTAIRLEAFYHTGVLYSAFIYYADENNQVSVIICRNSGEREILRDVSSRGLKASDLEYPVMNWPLKVIAHIGEPVAANWMRSNPAPYQSYANFRRDFGISEELWKQLISNP